MTISSNPILWFTSWAHILVKYENAKISIAVQCRVTLDLSVSASHETRMPTEFLKYGRPKGTYLMIFVVLPILYVYHKKEIADQHTFE